MWNTGRSCRCQLTCAGFSYAEVLLAVVLIAICLAPALEALRTAVGSSAVQEATLTDRYALQAKMEEVLAEPFAALTAAATMAGSPTTPTSYSDTAPFTTTDDRQIIRQVYIWPYDGDNADSDDDPFTGTDPGLLYVKVQSNGALFALETLTTQ
jgi:type II secretory pathway pseudopilin PulG